MSTFDDGRRAFTGPRHVTDRILRQRDALYRDRANHPLIPVQPIPAPVFIIGLPRSGTTYLHHLLATANPAARTIKTWQAVSLSPPPEPDDPRIAATQSMIDALPAAIQRARPSAADAPEECNAVTMLAFQSADLFSVYDQPGYVEWYLGADHSPAYELHRHVLQHLQAFTPGGRWLLKSPAHLFHLDALRHCYPDARLVFIHRDPAASFASLREMIAVYRDHLGERRPAAGELEALWTVALDRAQPFIPDCINIEFDDLTRDPAATVRLIEDSLKR